MIEFLEEQKMVSVSFDDLDVLSDQDKETFVLNLNFFEEQMPFYIKVQDYNFSFSGQSFLINGRSAMLPDLIEENEKNHQLTLLVERSNRFYIYLHQFESD
tara:strand:- start:610 stop:912 length:303 start_codon:yes stop_codon:yes gene_type:complete